MLQTTYNNLKRVNGKTPSVMKFIAGLRKKGIPLSAIKTNDWSSSPNTIVYITIPYGSKKNSGKTKSWKNRFGETTLKSAIKFWNSRK